MGRQEDEVERLKRLRERQLADRDPHARDRKLYQDLSRRRRGKKLTLGSILGDLQAKWTWMAGGGIVGAIAAVVTILVFKEKWAEYVGYAMIGFGVIVGRLLGAIRDWGDEDWGRKY